jgi:hypothetical protein
MSDDTMYLAIVERIYPNGPHGPYAVLSSDSIPRSVTLGLKPPAWQESDFPEPGTYVVLSRVIKKRAGYRAQHGRYMRPSDEQGA